jgi:hypothetical protein
MNRGGPIFRTASCLFAFRENIETITPGSQNGGRSEKNLKYDGNGKEINREKKGLK